MTTGSIHLNGKPISDIRRVACISTSRADAGIYRPLMRALIDSGYETLCLAGGTHLDPAYGGTIDQLEAIEGLRVVRVAHSTGDGTPKGVAAAAGEAMAAFGRALDDTRPELAFALGDRLEMLAAVLSASVARVPVAHLHGGERTTGAYDDACRDAITMMSSLHFVAAPAYAARLRSIAPDAGRVFCVGALAIDTLLQFKPLSVAATSRAIGLDMSAPTAMVLLHPETLSAIPAAEQGRIVVNALRDEDLRLLLFGVNADVGCDALGRELASFAKSRDDVVSVASADADVFHSCMAHAALMIGNSSSGVIEAASFGLPVVNVGERQGGRLRTKNVLDTPFDVAAIQSAIRRARTPAFRASLSGMPNPFGDGRAANRILRVLAGESCKMFE
ncbi:MAG TPA: UDP-N-acetylglucosamine 2-epimerase [Phycisphaerae bacterium]|nr:UDP-N-acetylglucosamine 2-epimerase [Phycisphaerae bacterium]HRW54194.1 UDP-N-acetylglucosamine 2-epimerase [Phycisphaerae bacterium]